ncbi:hypothetical protein J7E93_07365 [Streptomyces sp. ISL-36]|uniref:hypothetical protein n=1 Tax=Streptomyces sp. ISL-36 TaxID=2819182 RepID=UPI001BE73D26|nr:hypothetical protein [Streptomyces sp. ISL-36]MBT2439942.1 hypothetical protein [Streptomyces sp. ISL-36]
MTDRLDHDLLEQVYARGGATALVRALEDCAGMTEAEKDAAVDAVIVSITASGAARVDQLEARAAELEVKVRQQQVEIDELVDAEVDRFMADIKPGSDPLR